MLMDFLCATNVRGLDMGTGHWWLLLVWSLDSTDTVQFLLCLSIMLKTNPDSKHWSVSYSFPASLMCQSKFNIIRRGFYQGRNIKEGKEYLITGFSVTTVTAAFKSNFHALVKDVAYFSGKSSPSSNFYHILQIFLNEFYTLMQNQKRKEF